MADNDLNAQVESAKTFDRIELAAGPRKLPSWARDAHINWMDGWGNRPYLKVRCRTDPLAFSDFGKPVWEKRGADCWVAESEGVAAVHYHGGSVKETSFTRKIGGQWDMTKPQLLDGKPWIDTAGLWPDQIANAKPKMGGIEHETFTMLATSQQEGYAGRHFDITMKDGRDIRLRGPWHSAAPEGFVEVSYDIDERLNKTGGRVNRWWRPWYARGGYFGLYMRQEVLLDIFATFVAHVQWAHVVDGGKARLEPLRPETGLPKGWKVPVEQCPGHVFGVTSGGEHPYDQCAFCEAHRDPNYVNPYKRDAA